MSMKFVTKRVRGTGKIPKYDRYPPLQINDTETFFIQLKNMGFIVEDVEEKKPVEPSIKKEEIKPIVEEKKNETNEPINREIERVPEEVKEVEPKQEEAKEPVKSRVTRKTRGTRP